MHHAHQTLFVRTETPRGRERYNCKRSVEQQRRWHASTGGPESHGTCWSTCHRCPTAHMLTCSCNAVKSPPGFSVASLKRATTVNERVPSAEIYALVRLMKHVGRRVSLVVTDSWSYRSTNIMLTVERCGIRLRCSALRICFSSVSIVMQAAHHDFDN